MDELALCVPADVLASCSACLLRESATACRRPLRGQNLAWFLTHVHVPLFDFSAWTDEGAGGGGLTVCTYLVSASGVPAGRICCCVLLVF